MTELIDIALYSLLGISLTFSFRYIIEDYGCPAAAAGAVLLPRRRGIEDHDDDGAAAAAAAVLLPRRMGNEPAASAIPTRNSTGM